VVFLGRSLCRERVLVVASYRPDEMHRRHPLVIAVGQQLDDGLLSDVVGGGLGPLREALREAVANQILAVTSEGRYRFAPRSFEGGGPR
jgi:hypothetical protein